MSDPNQKSDGAPAGDDRIKNLQAEFERKSKNTEDKLSQIAETNKQLLAQIQLMQKPAPKPKEEVDLAAMLYDDPTKAVNMIKDEVRQDITKAYREEKQKETNQTKILNKIYSEFPEASQDDHDLTKRALEIFNQSGSNDPIMLQTAVYQAAAEQGIKPKSRRTVEEQDDYVGTSSSRNPRRRRERDSDELAPATLAFAEAVGLDVSNPKVIERLKTRRKTKLN